jgi:predicted SprT family Zn-dependent metalloprotease
MRLTNEEVRKLIKYTANKCGYTALIETEHRWSHKLRTTMGMAHSRYINGKFTQWIELSVEVFENASRSEQIETVVHEMCHIVDRYQRNVLFIRFPDKGGSHNPHWKDLMRQCGLQPRRCHNVKVRKNKRYECACSCRTHAVSGQKISKMARGAVYNCTHCSQPVKLTQRGYSEYISK